MTFALASIVMIIAGSLANTAGAPQTSGLGLGTMGKNGFVYGAVALALGLTGAHYGLRGHNAAVRGFATNGAMARMWGFVALGAALILIANAVLAVIGLYL